jgi:hypothetical protein
LKIDSPEKGPPSKVAQVCFLRNAKILGLTNFTGFQLRTLCNFQGVALKPLRVLGPKNVARLFKAKKENLKAYLLANFPIPRVWGMSWREDGCSAHHFQVVLLVLSGRLASFGDLMRDNKG